MRARRRPSPRAPARARPQAHGGALTSGRRANSLCHIPGLSLPGSLNDGVHLPALQGFSTAQVGVLGCCGPSAGLVSYLPRSAAAEGRLRCAQDLLPQLVCACTVSVIGAALDAHVRSAKERGWGHPVQLPRVSDADAMRPPLQVNSLSSFGCAASLHAAPDRCKLPKASCHTITGLPSQSCLDLSVSRPTQRLCAMLPQHWLRWEVYGHTGRIRRLQLILQQYMVSHWCLQASGCLNAGCRSRACGRTGWMVRGRALCATAWTLTPWYY